jgi:hypothetical protein
MCPPCGRLLLGGGRPPHPSNSVGLTTEDARRAGRLAITPTPPEYVGPVDFATTLIATLEPSVRAAGLPALVPNYLGVVPTRSR